MIAIIDYGMGNLGSVAKALKALGADITVTQSSRGLDKADKIVLPGVGSFGYCMRSLRKLKLIPALKRNIESGKSYLGLCLGMQILFEESKEGGNIKGLGILKGRVKKFNFTRSTQYAVRSTLKVPHMGWNQIKKSQSHNDTKTQEKNMCPLLTNIPEGTWMYFVHSYYVEPRDKDVIAATTDYGIDFCSMVWKDNIYATQFHPEKSQAFGMKMLENFAAL